MRVLGQLIADVLNTPKFVFILCGIIAIAGTLLDGTLYRMWELKTEKTRVQMKIEETKVTIAKLDQKIKLANDPKFIEREAKERFDFVDENDIVFVFSDEQ